MRLLKLLECGVGFEEDPTPQPWRNMYAVDDRARPRKDWVTPSQRPTGTPLVGVHYGADALGPR